MLTWRKLTSAKWEDAWLERLQIVGPTRLAVVRLANHKSLRIEAYGLTKKEGEGLVRQFGGQLREIKDKPISEPPARKPLAIRNRLWVVDSEKTARQLTDSRPVVIIPAAMAFGTGDHATTASCLRLLCDLSAEPTGPWDFLDLGSGSGILAIAAAKLGARKVEGCDFDPHAVRTAKENIELNQAGSVAMLKRDVLAWAPKRQWAVVAANLFSQVLIQAADAITAAVRPGGALILSGILVIQEKEVLAAFGKRGFTFEQAIHKGKWVSLLGRKKGAK